MTDEYVGGHKVGHVHLRLAAIEQEIREKGDAEVALLRGYMNQLLEGGDRHNTKSVRYGLRTMEHVKALANAHRLDKGVPESPYVPGTEEAIVFDFLLTRVDQPTSGEQALDHLKRNSPTFTGRRTLSLSVMLKDFALKKVGWRLDRAAGSPVTYRLVPVEGGASDE